MTSRFTRQQLVAKGAKATAALTVLGSPLLRASPAFATTVVRRDVGGMTAADPVIVSYRKAVAAMKALPASDPRSWSYQAAIHGTFVTPTHTAWNTCEHGTYFFWSWHRMYLYYFERIIRKMSGDYGFALPYWNYESASERQLPLVFRDAASPLYTANRGAGWNTGISSLSSFDVDTAAGFALTNFTSASSSIEGTPHAAVHVRIGGWMGSVPTAAQDPIFYLHHCNIDRLWNLWLAQGGGRTDPLSDATWKTQAFTFFDENAHQVTLTGCDVLRAAQQLSYGYQGEPAQVNEYCLRFRPPYLYTRSILYRLPIPPELLGPRLVSLKLDITSVRKRMLAAAESTSQTLFLQLDGVEAARQPGVVWQVYVGLPEGAKPHPESLNFVGNMALFGMGIRNAEKKKFMPATFSFPVDRAIAAVLKRGGNTVNLTLVPTGPLMHGKPSTPKPASTVKIGSFSFAVETSKKQ